MDSLQGNFLIATPQMPDARFAKQVVYICTHNDEGAMGMVINKPSSNSVYDILLAARIAIKSQCEWPPIYIGGPVETEAAFFIYTADYTGAKNYIEVSSGVNLSREPQILADIGRGKGPEKYLFVLGYAGWAAGQLENEFMHNGWLTVPAVNEILFDTPDKIKWEKSAQEYGIDISLFNDLAGTA